MSRLAGTFLCLLMTLCLFSSADDKGVDFSWAVKIPMRDGIHLNATLYKPQDQKDPLPVIFTLTPYMADTYHSRAMYFAQNGYVFAAIDVRGRGNSEGNFEPSPRNAKELEDCYDIVEWIARQPWCNGKVAMWGGSYAGWNQWEAAKVLPPHLSTIVPASCSHPCIDLSPVNNIPLANEIQWLTLVTGKVGNDNIYEQEQFWIDKYSEVYFKHLPFKQLDSVSGNPHPSFQKEMLHPTCDEYWKKWAPTPEEYARINIPILSIAGQYDDQQRGQIYGYRLHMKYAPSSEKEKHYLIIGPWDHGGTRSPSKQVGGLTFGDASVLDMNQFNRQWYDWTLKGKEKPPFFKKRVAYYVTGAEEWKYADDLDEVTSSRKTLYLDSAENPVDVFHSGTLSEAKPSKSESDQYVYDPLDTRPGELQKEPIENYLTDQRFALNLFGSGLIYHTAPFPTSTELTGNVKFVAWISMDVPDTDFEILLYEIRPDGSSVFLTEDRMRARYRESLETPKMVPPGEIVRYEFNLFSFFSRRIAQGSRLRVVFKSPNTIYWQKNYNSGGVVSEESGKDARTAHVTLHHHGNYLSYLEIPIGK